MNKFPTIQKMQRNLWLFGWLKIPMIAFCRPTIMTWDEQRVTIRIRRSRRTNNHLNSMYFGALMIGADLAAGMHAFAYSTSNDKKISLAFKSCSAIFFQRPESDVYFNAAAGELVKQMICKSIETKEWINEIITVDITDEQDILVAQVHMELSLKVK